MVSQAELISNGCHSLVSGLISICLETIWIPLSKKCITVPYDIYIVNLSRFVNFFMVFFVLNKNPLKGHFLSRSMLILNAKLLNHPLVQYFAICLKQNNRLFLYINV